MVGGAIRGVRHGRMMTLIVSAERANDRYARRGEPGFWFFALCWAGGGAIILYHALRLMYAA